eukprot:1197380-Pyramimonas_sp.AAC.1
MARLPPRPAPGQAASEDAEARLSGAPSQPRRFAPVVGWSPRSALRKPMRCFARVETTGLGPSQCRTRFLKRAGTPWAQHRRHTKRGPTLKGS